MPIPVLGHSHPASTVTKCHYIFCPTLFSPVLLWSCWPTHHHSLHISLSLIARNPEESRFFFSCRHFYVPGQKKSPLPADGLANRLPMSSVADPSVSPLHPPVMASLWGGSSCLSLIWLCLQPSPILLPSSSFPFPVTQSTYSLQVVPPQVAGVPLTSIQTHGHVYVTAHVDGHTNTENNRFKTLFNSRLFFLFLFFNLFCSFLPFQ